MAKNERLDYDLEINEGETPAVTLEARDHLSVLVPTNTITNIMLRVDDYFSDTAIKANTDLGIAANPVTYTLLEAETRVINKEREYEYRFMTFDFTYAGSRHITDEYILKIINLKYHEV
jgi:hypothetical protein